MSLALCIIAKDEVEAVKRIIEVYGKWFDEICIAVDARHEEFEALQSDKVKIHRYEWINDFSHKRNFLASKVTSEYYFRMDTDDDLESPELIPELMSAAYQHNIDVLHVPYIYARDKAGNCVAKHWRETIIKRRTDVYWKKTIHENIFAEDEKAIRIVRDPRVKIIHNIDDAHVQKSGTRNFEILMEEFKRDGENTDPRTIAYLGRMLQGFGQWEKAILCLENLVQRSGWDDDKYFAWVQMSQCYQQLGKYKQALGCAREALAMNTKFPDAYLQMGFVYLAQKDYQKAVDWIMPGIVRPEPDTSMVIDPSFYGYKAKLNAAIALLGKGDVAMACQYYAQAYKLSPTDPEVKKWEATFQEAQDNDMYVKSLSTMVSYISRYDRPKLAELAKSIPPYTLKDERVCAIRNQIIPPQTWADNSVVIYCGNAWEDWSPISVMRGIGGSEEAVIYLSKELTRLGYKVTVYNQCGDIGGVFDGVEYKNYFEFNAQDKYNILIGWRMDTISHVSAKFKAIWLHDVPQDGMFTEQTVKGIDKVIVLSEYHKTLLPSVIPPQKVFVSTNGINLPDFEKNTAIREPKRMIYTSSYDRGLQHLLQMWPEVKNAVPDATLHVFYGWNTYDKMLEVGARSAKYKTAMVELMKQDGVTDHGRVGHRQLVKEFQKSGVWVYPSHFEEISCISAMKAQAAGCVPVCTDYAALAETVKAGVKVKGSTIDGEVCESFKKSLIEVLQDEKRQGLLREEVLQHKATFGWDRVASLWASSLFPAKEAL